MKIKIKDDSVIFIPENDMDCFGLGRMNIPHKLFATRDTDNLGYEINRFEITVKDLIDFLTKAFINRTGDR